MSKTIATASIAALMALSLGACGSQRGLKPVAGTSLPPAPYGRTTPPTAEELLEAGPQSKPERNVELRRRSEERTDDPFDLPPE